MGDGQPRLLDQVRDRIRRKHYSVRTEQAYVDLDPELRVASQQATPRDMGAAEVEAFLTHLAVNRGGRGVRSPLDGVGVLPVFFTAAKPYAVGGLRRKQRV